MKTVYLKDPVNTKASRNREETLRYVVYINNQGTKKRFSTTTKPSSSAVDKSTFGRRKERWLYGMLILLALGMVWNNSRLFRPISRAHRQSEAEDETSVLPFVTPMANTGHPSPNLREEPHRTKDSVRNSVEDGPTARAINVSDHPPEPEDSRPWLVLHVGPPKTATTTIQSGLVRNAEFLATQDDWYFAGHDLRQTTRSLGRNRGNPTIFPLRAVMNHDAFRTELEALRKLNRNVILSAEHFSSWFFKSWKRFYTNKFLLPPDAPDGNGSSLEPLFGFRVKIVVGYRHFFEWLPSLYYQMHILPKEHGTPGIVEFVETYLDRLVQHDPDGANGTTTNMHTTAGFGKNHQRGGMRLHTKNESETSHGSVWAYLKWTSQPELAERVDVFDMHQQPVGGNSNSSNSSNNDVLANFVCQMVPSASHTCQHLLGNPAEAIVKRSSSTEKFASIADKNRIYEWAQQKLQLKIDPEGNRTHLDDSMDQWFAIAGLEAGTTEDSKSKALKRCLGAESTLRLKKASWNFLRQMALLTRSHAASRNEKDEGYYSSLFQSSVPTDHLLLSSQFRGDNHEGDDDAWMVPTKAAHDASFDNFVKKGRLCELRVEELLKDENFVREVFS